MGSLGYNGEVREAGVCWYLLGNGYRAFNPLLMRFHSPDSWSPFGKGGINAYMYVSGNPVAYKDPTGHTLVGNIIRSWRGIITTKSVGAEVIPEAMRKLGSGNKSARLFAITEQDVANAASKKVAIGARANFSKKQFAEYRAKYEEAGRAGHHPSVEFYYKKLSAVSKQFDKQVAAYKSAHDDHIYLELNKGNLGITRHSSADLSQYYTRPTYNPRAAYLQRIEIQPPTPQKAADNAAQREIRANHEKKSLGVNPD